MGKHCDSFYVCLPDALHIKRTGFPAISSLIDEIVVINGDSNSGDLLSRSTERCALLGPNSI